MDIEDILTEEEVSRYVDDWIDKYKRTREKTYEEELREKEQEWDRRHGIHRFY